MAILKIHLSCLSEEDKIEYNRLLGEIADINAEIDASLAGGPKAAVKQTKRRSKLLDIHSGLLLSCYKLSIRAQRLYFEQNRKNATAIIRDMRSIVDALEFSDFEQERQKSADYLATLLANRDKIITSGRTGDEFEAEIEMFSDYIEREQLMQDNPAIFAAYFIRQQISVQEDAIFDSYAKKTPYSYNDGFIDCDYIAEFLGAQETDIIEKKIKEWGFAFTPESFIKLNINPEHKDEFQAIITDKSAKKETKTEITCLPGLLTSSQTYTGVCFDLGLSTLSPQRFAKEYDPEQRKDVFRSLDNPQITISSIADANLSIEVDKMVMAGIIYFANTHHISKKKDPEKEDGTIEIPFAEYAQICGYKTMTTLQPSDPGYQAERKRIKFTRGNLRKSYNNVLNTLYNADITVETKDRKGAQTITHLRVIDRYSEVTDYISFRFSKEMLNFINSCVLSTYHRALFRIEGRKQGEYNLARKMSEHYYMACNVTKGTNDILSVKILLDSALLPKYTEEIKKQGWRRVIYDPFITKLDNLITEGFLSSWSLCKSKKVGLSPDELKAARTDYKYFRTLFVKYTLTTNADTIASTPDADVDRFS